MLLEEEKLYKSILRILGTIFLALTYYHEYENQSLGILGAVICIFLLYVILIWGQKSWWRAWRLWTASLLIIGIALSIHYINGSTDSSLLWPLLVVLLFDGGRRRESLIICGMTIMCIVLMYAFSLNTLLTLLSIILVIRSIQIRREANRVTRVHLQELNEAHKKLKDAHAELQEASIHSMRYAALEERTRLARELHDGLGHQITSLIIQLQALQVIQDSDPRTASVMINQLVGIARQAMTEVRVAVKELSDDETGLGLVALKGLVSQIQGRSAIQFSFVQDSPISEWSIRTSTTLYRILQEALTNVLKHSQATVAAVHLQEREDRIHLTVSDNGMLSDASEFMKGYGLKGISERCSELGGHCRFSIIEPHGFRVEAILPMDSESQWMEKERDQA